MKTIPLLVCLLLAISLSSFITTKAQVNQTDSLALVDFYNSTGGANCYTNSNWLTKAPVSTWAGIVVENNRVTYVSLSTNNLRGSVPLSFSHLTSLDALDLSRNHIGDSIPAVITQLASLTYLNLSQDHFSKPIPSSIGNLTNLTMLYLNNNELTGEVPASIGNLTNLFQLYLYANHLSGPLPSSIGNLAKLNELFIQSNNLSGRLPASIGRLTNLQYLVANNNQFTGLPAETGGLTNLYELYLAHNRLTDSLPSSMSNCVNLTILDVSFNNLGGAIRSFLGNLPKIFILHLDHNQFSGSVPRSFGRNKSITNLYLQNNQLSQTGNVSVSAFPPALANSDVSRNRFTFDGLEGLVQKSPYTLVTPQAFIPIHRYGDTLPVYAGGTLQNNTYTWYKTDEGKQLAISGDSTFAPAAGGRYYATVRNSIVKNLILRTDTFTFTANSAVAISRIVAGTGSGKSTGDFRVYPNPASHALHLQVRGTAVIEVMNSMGKIWLSRSISTSDEIDVSAWASGTYYIQNKTTGETKQVIVAH